MSIKVQMSKDSLRKYNTVFFFLNHSEDFQAIFFKMSLLDTTSLNYIYKMPKIILVIEILRVSLGP